MIFVISTEDEAQWRSYKQYYVLIVEIKNDNIMIDEQNVFDELSEKRWLHGCFFAGL